MNKGQMILSLSRSGSSSKIESTFQASSVNMPFMSVGQICDRGFRVVFDSKRATVFKQGSDKMAERFERRNGFYVGDFDATPATAKVRFPWQGN